MIQWLDESTGLLPGAVNIGFVKLEAGSFLIDTGIDNSAINKALKTIKFPIEGALMTHHHADHMGGAHKLTQLGITKLYGSNKELDLYRNPRNGIPYSMFGGSAPPKTLRNRYLEAKPCEYIQSADDFDFKIDIKIIDSPGHSLGHVAYLINNVLFAGDSVFTEETIEKYNLLFVVDPNKAINSLETIEKEKFSAMIPGHGQATEERSSSLHKIKSTKDHFLRIKDQILNEVIGEGIFYHTFIKENIKNFELEYTIKKRGVTQYFLFQTSIMAYLSNFLDEKKVELELQGSKLKINPI